MSLTNAPETKPAPGRGAELLRALPNNFQVIFGSSITSTVIVVFTLNLVFNHWSWRRQGTESAVEVAVREGAVAVNVPDDGVKVSDVT